jgi:hypothetical protein
MTVQAVARPAGRRVAGAPGDGTRPDGAGTSIARWQRSVYNFALTSPG